MTKNLEILKEWNLEDVGSFIDIVKDESANILKANFTKKTVSLMVSSYFDREEEPTVTMEIKENTNKNESSDIYLENVDVYTTGATLYLTNGKSISLSINYNDNFDGDYEGQEYTVKMQYI